MRPKQAQAVEDDNNRAAFVADDAGGKIDLLCQRRNDQKKDYAKRNDNVLANDRARAPAQDERLLDILNLVVHQDHVGLFQRCIGSASAHAERDIRGGQTRRIVHRSGKRIVANASQS